MATCPNCKKKIQEVRFQIVKSRHSFGRDILNSIAHCCPMCDSILSVEVDPIAVKTDTVRELMKRLGR